MSEKFISIEGIAKRYPAPGGGATTIFEDLWLAMSRGEFASNGQLVERAVTILSAMNVRVLGPAEVRQRLKLTKRG